MKRKFLLLSCLILILSVNNQLTYAQGDLMVMPKRLVFDGSQRSQEINLANTGKDTAVYAISFINYKMTESGNFEQIEIPEEGQKFATDFLRYFPRRVTLAPNESQTIRVQLTRTGNLEDGEYRSHMYFRAVEKQIALGEEDQKSADAISINIKTVFGISIPLIIRHGDSSTRVKISDANLDLKNEFPILQMVINRSGNMSVYGDFNIYHISPSGLETQIGFIKGVAVYTPNTQRNFIFEILATENINYKEGKLRIQYITEDKQELAKYELSLKM